jgi:glutaconate CoA-transferase subunit B
VITTLAVFGFDPASREMVLESTHPGVDADEVRRETGWPLAVSPALGETPPPTAEELEALGRFDPEGLWTR